MSFWSLLLALFVFSTYVTRQLPRQKPVFDTVLPANSGSVAEKGVFIVEKTNGFRQESIEPGTKTFKKVEKEKRWDVRTTENGAFVNDEYLSRFNVIVFPFTTGDIPTPEQEKAFGKFVESGGGYVGVYAAHRSGHGGSMVCRLSFLWQ